jgi:hypothetical protein
MSLKGVVLNFNLYNPNFKNYYFYITTIFEINSGIIYSYRQNVEIYQVDAYYNMTSKEYLYDFILLDIFRFSITIALGLIFLRDWGDTIYKRYKKISDENLLFNGRILHDGVIIVFFLYRYSVKLYYSFIKIDYENMVTFQDVSFDGNSYYTKQNYFELYEKKVFFIEDRLCDILLFFLSFIKSISFLLYIPKLKSFIFLVIDAIKRSYWYYIFYCLIFFSFCVVFHNLFGAGQKNLQTLEDTLSFILLFCNGHNNFITERTTFNLSEIIMIIFLFILIVYFLNSLFFAFYLESFRIVSWTYGFSYQQNFMDFFNFCKANEIKIKKKKEEKVEKKNDNENNNNKNDVYVNVINNNNK